jgi:predicted transcriptional regulator
MTEEVCGRCIRIGAGVEQLVMKTTDVMSTPVQCCRPDDTLAHAAEDMWDYEIQNMPVVDEAGRPIGLVTDRSICMTALRSRRRLDLLRVDQAMLSEVPTVHQDVPLEELERVLRGADVRWAAVVADGGAVVGVVTPGDVERALQALGKRAIRRARTTGVLRRVS